MKKMIVAVLISIAFSLCLVGLAADAAAAPPPSPPGQGECEHGNSGKPCRPDPQPDRGKDCEEHGKKGGVNEDHCAGGEQPPVDPPVTPPVDPPVGPPVDPPVTEPPTSELPGTPESTTPETVTETVETNVPVTRKSLKKTLAKQAQENGANAPSGPAASAAQGREELPYTGLPLWAWTLLGAALTGGGLYLRRL